MNEDINLDANSELNEVVIPSVDTETENSENNDSSPILASGISEEGFSNLLNSLKKTIIDEGYKSLNNYKDMIDELRQTKPGEETEKWIQKFQTQVEHTNQVINNNYKEIEELFKQIDIDWKEYQESEDIKDES